MSGTLMYTRPINKMTCYRCKRKLVADEIAYYSTYKEMFLICTECIKQISIDHLAELESNFSEKLWSKNETKNTDL